MKYIPLTQGKRTKVSDEDYDWLMQWQWHILRGAAGDYAIRCQWTGTRQIGILMHREILGISGLGRKYPVDHINHDTLDNQRTNLRQCTIRENVLNSRKSKGRNTYLGVHWHTVNKKWCAQCNINGKRHVIGHYDNEIKAAIIRDAVVREVYGDFAVLNFPNMFVQTTK